MFNSSFACTYMKFQQCQLKVNFRRNMSSVTAEYYCCFVCLKDEVLMRVTADHNSTSVGTVTPLTAVD